MNTEEEMYEEEQDRKYDRYLEDQEREATDEEYDDIADNYEGQFDGD